MTQDELSKVLGTKTFKLHANGVDVVVLERESSDKHRGFVTVNLKKRTWAMGWNLGLGIGGYRGANWRKRLIQEAWAQLQIAQGDLNP